MSCTASAPQQPRMQARQAQCQNTGGAAHRHTRAAIVARRAGEGFPAAGHGGNGELRQGGAPRDAKLDVFAGLVKGVDGGGRVRQALGLGWLDHLQATGVGLGQQVSWQHHLLAHVVLAA